MIKHVKEGNRINILHLIIGLLLIMLGLYPIGKLNCNFLET